MTTNEVDPKPPKYESPSGYRTFDFKMPEVKKYCDSVTPAKALKYLEWLKKEAEQAEAEEAESVLKGFGQVHAVRKVVAELNYRKSLLKEENKPQGQKPADKSEPIQWLGKHTQLVYLLKRMQDEGFISKAQDIVPIVEKHFCNDKHGAFKNTSQVFQNVFKLNQKGARKSDVIDQTIIDTKK